MNFEAVRKLLKPLSDPQFADWMRKHGPFGVEDGTGVEDLEPTSREELLAKGLRQFTIQDDGDANTKI